MNLAVSLEVRRRGIGRTLLSHALAVGQQEAASRALLEVRASNTGAVALYEQAGFRVTGRRRAYYRQPEEDAVLMEKNLVVVNKVVSQQEAVWPQTRG